VVQHQKGGVQLREHIMIMRSRGASFQVPRLQMHDKSALGVRHFLFRFEVYLLPLCLSNRGRSLTSREQQTERDCYGASEARVWK